MTRLYRYVGPSSILEEARHSPKGFSPATPADLRAWLANAGRGREVTVTFVVDEAGALRLADRRSEHVACAGGGPVRAAGELTFALERERARVVGASNQSTGYCPEPASSTAVAAALDAIGVPHPGRYTDAFEFRRCPACAQTNLVKDGVLRCDACDAELPGEWNFAALPA